MDGLDLNNILSDSEIEALFNGPYDEETNKETQDTPPEEKEEETEETTETEIDDLFESESVGSEETEDKEETSSTGKGTPSKFFSSIARSFVEEGIFPDLDEERISKVNSPEDFRELIEERLKSELDERQRRVDEALGVGVEPDTIRQYEATLKYLDGIDESTISSETQEGETLRRNLIAQDYINRGYSKERAQKAVEKSFKNGDDIDDAKEALAGNKDFFKAQYDNLVKEAKEEQNRIAEERKQQSEELKNSILNDKKFFGELEVDKNTRQKIYDNIAKPVYKDPKTGNVYSAIQKYEMEHRTDFLKNLSLCFTLTDGFKNLDNLVKNKVRKEIKKGFRNLEDTINSSSRGSDGRLKFVSGVDSESFISGGWDLDI